MSEGATAKTRLSSWKEVAAFFQRTERTVRRWELERGLPIRRLPGAGKSRIFAEIAELEAWRNSEGLPGEPEASAATVRGARGGGRIGLARWTPALAGLGALLVLAVGVLILWRPISTLATAAASRSSVDAKPPPLDAQRLYVQGADAWARRTPASLNRAVEDFTAALRRHPDYAEAWMGLANCYDLMPEFTQMPASQAFPLARDAARRALALDDHLAEAHTALAFAEFFGFRDAAAARREFQRAIALDPNSERARHWYATFLAADGDPLAAVREIDRALALNPRSTAIRADRGFLLFGAGRRAESIASLQALEASDPQFLSTHNYLAEVYLEEHRERDFLRESEIAARLSNDLSRMALITEAGRGYAAGGRRGMLEAMANQQVRQYENGVGTADGVARTYALLGDSRRAAAYFKLSADRREMAGQVP